MIYKITFDIQATNLNKLVDTLAKYEVDACFGEDSLYLYLPPTRTKYFSYLMRESNIGEHFVKQITTRPTNTPTNSVQNWVWEKFNQEEKEQLEAQEQAKLRQMMDNINKVRQEVEKIKSVSRETNQKNNEGGAAK